MKMTPNKLFLGLCLIFSIFACQESKEGEVVYSETFNIDELDDFTEADHDFVEKYGDYLKSTVEIYNLGDSLIDENSKMHAKSNNLNQTIEFELDYSTGKSKYYVLNNLAKFHDLNNTKKGWDLGENSFWSGLFSKNVKKEEFTEFKNNKVYSIGEYSEYSELPIGDKVMIIWHFKWRKLILHFDQLVEPEQKSQFIQKIYDSFEKIKDSYNTVDQEKIDQVVDKALDNMKNEGL